MIVRCDALLVGVYELPMHFVGSRAISSPFINFYNFQLTLIEILLYDFVQIVFCFDCVSSVARQSWILFATLQHSLVSNFVRDSSQATTASTFH